MKSCYIHSAVSISAQNTFDTEEFLADAIQYSINKVNAIHPNYKDYITPSASRRMATGVKMGVTAATKALLLADIKQSEAIITGTGMGCIEDTEKFLNSIIENDEAFLTPTSFIQSTHNTVGAQIALGLKCKAYNNTFVNASLSFESALLDAQLMIQQNEANSILVGGVDELGSEFVDYVRMLEEKDLKGIKIPFGEGASFFVLSSEEKLGSVKIQDLETINSASKTEIVLRMNAFLKLNTIKAEDIDAVVLGTNGDRFDDYYETITSTLFPTITQLHYKHLCGEFYTASGFGLWMATQVLEHQIIPKAVLKVNTLKKPLKNILLYNQFKGRNHSFILLSKC